MLEWEVLEEEEAKLPEGMGEKRSLAWRQILLWFLLLLLLGMALSAGLWWQRRAQLRALRMDLQGVVETEARLKALGEWEQAEPLLDPSAPLEWKNAYLYYLSHAQALPGIPRVSALSLEEGQRAIVEVSWPAPEQGEGSVGVSERRAYRLVEGTWRRAPLHPGERPVEEVTTAHFVLRGDEEELSALLDGATWRFDPEALYQRLSSSWPAEWLEPRPITLVVRRQEFGPAVQKTPSRRMLLVNSPFLSYLVSNEPLSSPAYYRLQLTDHLILKILPVRRPETMDEESVERYALLQRQLQWAEARRWALDEAEQAYLREHWRAALAGEWRTPLDPGIIPPDTSEPGEWERYWIEMNLLLDYLIEAHGPDAPGRIARGLAAVADEPTFDRETMVSVFLNVTGGTLGELESAARAYALAE